MHKRFTVCAVIVLVLTAAGIFACTALELYPRTVPVFPVRDALTNDFFALERWLAETGHPVRVETRGSPSGIVSGGEQTALVQASACVWENADTVLMPWIERGGFLVICLEAEDLYDDDLAAFLADCGIRPEVDGSGEAEDGGWPEPADPLADMENLPEETDVPDFDRAIWFGAGNTQAAGAGGNVFTMRDGEGVVRLARFSRGDGAITVIGRPLCMYNDYLEREINARLAWELSGARTSAAEPGLLFIREKRVTRGLLGKIADRGAVFPLALSALLLVIVGFWAVIPMFGPVFSEQRSRARPIGERFRAEVRFLKKYGALQSYLETYARELKSQAGDGEGDCAAIEAALRPGMPGRNMKYRDIINGLRKLESLMERI
jgi:hypothetical protein